MNGLWKKVRCGQQPTILTVVHCISREFDTCALYVENTNFLRLRMVNILFNLRLIASNEMRISVLPFNPY